MRHSSRYAFLLLGAATLLAAGCEKPRSETAAEDTLATRTGETMYPDTGTPRLVSIDLGKAIGADMRVTDETDDFRPRDTIYASTVVKAARESTSRPEWGIVTFEHRGTNQRGELVCTCLRNGMMLKRPAAEGS